MVVVYVLDYRYNTKVLECCIYNRLVDHIQKMLLDEQHGFLRGKSCVGQLLSVLDRIGKNLDIGLQTDILYLDIAKAFDTVDHATNFFRNSFISVLQTKF